MRKVIGIGETIFDIIFKNGQPTAAVPGGSTFNGIISLGRVGVDVAFISETGNDQVGETILNFMRENGVATDYVQVYPNSQSPISLAFLNEQNDANYIFYKDYPAARLDVSFPQVSSDDIVMFGSYFALNPVLRAKVVEFLEYARKQGAILYYDVNFRSTHRNEAIKLTSTIIENLEYADIVRGSVDDFYNLYNLTDVDAIYKGKIEFYCPQFICTHGGEGISLRSRSVCKEYPAQSIQPVSTIGAGDNFNAGLVYGLLHYRICRDALSTLSCKEWDDIIACGRDFATNACMSLDNSVSREFAEQYIGKGR